MEGSKNMATKTAISSNKKSTTEEPQATTSTVKSSSKGVRMTYKAFCKKLKKMPLIGAMVAEFIGTFLLIAAIFAVQGQPLYVAFVLVAIVLIIGNVSGAYVNPAMTIGAWVTQKIKGLHMIGYVAAQVLGAFTAVATLNLFLKASTAVSTTGQSLFHAASITSFSSDKDWMLFFAELLGATILALGIASVSRIKKANITTAFSYGLAILIALLFAGWATSSSLTEANTGLSFLNPAVAMAANGISWNMWPIAIYAIAPAIGGIIGFAIQDFFKSQTDEIVCDCDCCDTK